MAVLSVTGRDRDGDLLAEPVDWPSDQPPPRIVVTVRRAGPTPGVGDRMLARLAPGQEGEFNAVPVKLIAGAPETVIGVVRRGPHEARLEPVDRKQKELVLDDPGNAKEGDLVRVSVAGRARYGLEHGRIVEVIGSMKSEKAVSLIAILAHGIPHVFPPDALAEAAAAKPAPLAGREDWRALPLVTIDPRRRQGPRRRGPRRARSRRGQPRRPHRHRRDRRRRLVRAAGRRPRPRGARPAATRSTSPTASCRCCPSASPTTSARSAQHEDRPALAVRMVFSARRAQAQPSLPPHHDAVGGEAVLPARRRTPSTAAASTCRSRSRPRSTRYGQATAASRSAATSASRWSSTCPSAR